MDVRVNTRLNELREAGDWTGVEEAARELLKRDPNDVFALRALAQALEHQDAREELPKIWRRLADLEDRPGAVEKALGAHYLEQGDRESAVKWFRRALGSFIRARDESEVEDLWLELCELNPADLDWFLSMSDRLAGARWREQAAVLLQLLVPYFEEHARWDDVLTILKRAAALAPKDLSIRDAVIKALRAKHAGAPALEHVIDHSGLRRSGTILEALEWAQRFIPFSDGEACCHPDWGVGLVSELNLFSERVTIDFERKRNHEMSVGLAQKILEPLRHRDIRAAAVREPDRVADLVKNDPVQIVKMALISCGRKASTRQIKERLCGSVIPEEQWSKWWSNAVGLLRRDPYIGSTGAASKTYILRDEAGSADDEWMEQFDKKKNPLDKTDVVFSYLRSVSQSNRSTDLLRRFSVSLSALARERRKPSVRAEIYLTLEDLNEIAPSIDRPSEESYEEILKDMSDAVGLVCDLRREEHQWRLAVRLKALYPDRWPEICKSLMLSSRCLIRDRVAADLRSEGQRYVLEDLAREAALDPRNHPNAFVWFSEQVLFKPEDAIPLGIEPPVLFERLLALIDFLSDRAKRVEKEEAEDLRRAASAARDLVKRDNFAVLHSLLENMDRSVAMSLYKRASGNAGLDVRARERITRRILGRFPGLFAAADDEVGKPKEFLCTRKTLDERRERLRYIVEIELPRITDEIEEARKQGDLSENAEYHAARDKQKTLAGEAGDLQEQLANARPVDLNTVIADRVRFGVRMRVNDGEGTEEEIVVLGPWESDPSNNILSYQAPFTSCFIGKKEGETVQVDLPNRSGMFTVSSIEPLPDEIAARFN